MTFAHIRWHNQFLKSIYIHENDFLCDFIAIGYVDRKHCTKKLRKQIEQNILIVIASITPSQD